MRRRWIVLASALAIMLLVVVWSAVVTAAPPAQDVIVGQGPTAGMKQLYRSFSDGAYYAPVVSLAPFDDATGAATTIDIVHHEVHEGEMWHAEHTNIAVSDKAAVNVLLHVGGAVDAHTVFEVFASGQVTVSLWESPTLNTVGTALTAYNMDRAITTTANSQIYHSPAITATGSVALVNGRLLPGGTSSQTRVGGGVRQGVEWILAPGKYYLLRATNSSGTTAAINVVIEWYEETVAVD
jgi:hypothetical protein